MVRHGEVVAQKREPPVGPGRAPLPHLAGRSPQSTHKGGEHVPVQRIPDESNVGVAVEVEEAEGIERWEVAAGGLPAPPEEVPAVGFAAGDAVPALEDLLAGAVVAGGDGTRVADPGAGRVVAGAVRLLAELGGGELALRSDGGSEGGEDEEEGGEEDKGGEVR